MIYAVEVHVGRMAYEGEVARKRPRIKPEALNQNKIEFLRPTKMIKPRAKAIARLRSRRIGVGQTFP